jgi:hypothetical protein
MVRPLPRVQLDRNTDKTSVAQPACIASDSPMSATPASGTSATTAPRPSRPGWSLMRHLMSKTLLTLLGASSTGPSSMRVRPKPRSRSPLALTRVRFACRRPGPNRRLPDRASARWTPTRGGEGPRSDGGCSSGARVCQELVLVIYPPPPFSISPLSSGRPVCRMTITPHLESVKEGLEAEGVDDLA